MNAYLFKLCTITSLFIALLVVGYSSTPYAPMTILLFVGICVTFSIGPKKENLKNYLASVTCGVIWGFLFIELMGLLGSLGLSTVVVTFLANFLLVLAATIVHLILLSKTWMNEVGFIFAGVIGVVVNCSLLLNPPTFANILGVFISLVCGILIAIASVMCTDLISKPKKVNE